MFDQQQQSILYLSAARGLAKKLNVEDAIDNNIIERVNENRNNRDSLLTIVSDAYWSLNGYLKEGEREEVSALVIVGGWIEGLYLATSHATPDNEALNQRIAEQKYSLKDLIALVSSYENAEDLAPVKADLMEIQALFDQVEINKEKTETSKDESGTMVIGGASSTNVSDATMESIQAKIQEVRNQYIQ
jgi:tRNA splicing endonuclease